jgi:ArsR family transcriptional regulator, virulence genes transcriptional regulator
MNVVSPVEPDMQAHLLECARDGAILMRALSHEGRLLICCHLLGGERSVGELESLLGMRQSAVSQQLARLRQDGIVQARRDGKTIWYSLACPRARALMATMHSLF